MSLVKRWLWAPWHIKLCFIFVMVLLLVMVCAPLLLPYDPNATDLRNINQPPVFTGGSWEHLLGTDQLGRDVLSRNLYGIRISAGIALFSLVIGCVIGVSAGLVSGYMGGVADKIVTGLVDFQFSVPNTLIILLGIVLFGTDIVVLVVLIGITKWETYARVTRGLVLSLRQNQYVEAAQAAGASGFYIIRKHLLPNIWPTVLVMMTLFFPTVLTIESSLSFLGIGIQPPTATLGRMIGDGRDFLFTSWWISLIPAFIILCMTLIMQTIGDWFKESMDITITRE